MPMADRTSTTPVDQAHLLDRPLRCIVVTPEATILDRPAEFIALPLYDGEIGIGRGHSPLIGRLGYGEMRLRTAAGQTERYSVDGGFVQVVGNVVSVLTAEAILASAIDPVSPPRHLRAAHSAGGHQRPAVRPARPAGSPGACPTADCPPRLAVAPAVAARGRMSGPHRRALGTFCRAARKVNLRIGCFGPRLHSRGKLIGRWRSRCKESQKSASYLRHADSPSAGSDKIRATVPPRFKRSPRHDRSSLLGDGRNRLRQARRLKSAPQAKRVGSTPQAMVFSASQIVGLIEIETASIAGSECLVALGLEEQSLADLLAWLTGAIARPAVGDAAADRPSAAGPVNRLAGLIAADSEPRLAADLTQLQTDLADAVAQFQLKLTANAAE